MKVLLIGSGGREHALGWRLATSPSVSAVVSAPGNPGLAKLGTTITTDVTDAAAVVDAAIQTEADIIVVGPEAPLVAGEADAAQKKGIPVFGPTAAGAQLESSKAYAKEIMRRAGVPTAQAHVADDAVTALSHLRTSTPPYVVKADGLAAGKGVLVTPDLSAAEAWVDDCFAGRFGSAGARVVIEEFLDGDEVSVFAICRGTSVLPLEPARDYKRLGDHDTGPNTGGMGSYSPVTDLPAGLVDWTVAKVLQPVLATMADDGITYCGFLYAGLMLTADGPKVLEFNCRLGDPETQALMPRLRTDLGRVLLDAASGRSLPDELEWGDDHAVDIVLASAGYPDAPRTGVTMLGVDQAAERPGVHVFHAGTAVRDGSLVTAGGRVLNIVGTGSSLAEARIRAYSAAGLVKFDGQQHRSDIGGTDT